MNDLLKRSLHTFWQSFVVVFLGGMYDVFNAFQNGMGIGKAALLALALSAAAAGFSAIKTFVSHTK